MEVQDLKRRVCPDATMPVILASRASTTDFPVTSIGEARRRTCVGRVRRASARGARASRTRSDLTPPLLSPKDDGALTNSSTRARHRRPARADALDSDTGNIGCAIPREAVTAAQRQRGNGRLRTGGIPRTACGVPRTRRRGEETVGRIRPAPAGDHQRGWRSRRRWTWQRGGGRSQGDRRAAGGRRGADCDRTTHHRGAASGKDGCRGEGPRKPICCGGGDRPTDTRAANSSAAFEQAGRRHEREKAESARSASGGEARGLRNDAHCGSATAARRPKPPTQTAADKPRWLPKGASRRWNAATRAAVSNKGAERRATAAAAQRPKPPVTTCAEQAALVANKARVAEEQRATRASGSTKPRKRRAAAEAAIAAAEAQSR